MAASIPSRRALRTAVENWIAMSYSGVSSDLREVPHTLTDMDAHDIGPGLDLELPPDTLEAAGQLRDGGGMWQPLVIDQHVVTPDPDADIRGLGRHLGPRRPRERVVGEQARDRRVVAEDLERAEIRRLAPAEALRLPGVGVLLGLEGWVEFVDLAIGDQQGPAGPALVDDVVDRDEVADAGERDAVVGWIDDPTELVVLLGAVERQIYPGVTHGPQARRVDQLEPAPRPDQLLGDGGQPRGRDLHQPVLGGVVDAGRAGDDRAARQAGLVHVDLLDSHARRMRARDHAGEVRRAQDGGLVQHRHADDRVFRR